MRWITVGIVAIALGLGLGCQRAAESPKDPLIGRWKFEGMDLYQTYNSKGRVRYDFPEGDTCVGAYTVKDGAIAVTYDEGQKSCIDGTITFTLSADGQTLSFSSAKYVRVDARDDTSF